MRRDHFRRPALALALWSLISIPVLLKGNPNDGGSWWGLAGGIVALGVATAMWRRLPLAALGVALVLSALHSMELVSPAYGPATAVFGYLAGRHTQHARPALYTFAGAVAAGLVATLAVGDDLMVWFVQAGSLLFLVVVPWLLGRNVRQYAELVRTGWQLADRMEREQRAVADRERLRERSRIAGDMHDSLGHDLSLIALRAAALEVDRALDARQRTAARELRQAAADATARLRDIVGVLRTGEEGASTVPHDETVRALVERARDSGVAVELREEGAGDGLPEMTGRAVHRVVQESLTNAAKHAPGADVTVRIVRGADSVTATVGSGPPDHAAEPGLASGGTGLVGLDERVRLAGGTLSHGLRPDGGFTVTARLPTAATATEVPAPVPGPPWTSTSQRELVLAKRRVRRRLVQAVVVPVTVVGVLAVLMFGFDQYTRTRTVLDRGGYDGLRVGDTRDAVSARLPERSLKERPAGVDREPPDAGDCVYYRVERFSDTPAYRLCFKGGRLASKAVVVDVADEEHRASGAAAP
ncbi:sensor histidine kinase [Streptomyces sp. NPDC051018]|uniref:sensor histidine kinase n=1 Tax=Streptomyces sp. NPDC051018 TaxID=3365639 RepID=UPI00378E4853